MKRSKKRIVAKLGRVCKYLNKIESLPEHQGCAMTIRKARTLTQQAIKYLSAKDGDSATSGKMVTILRCLTEFFILLDWLKNYFNFCQQPFPYAYGKDKHIMNRK